MLLKRIIDGVALVSAGQGEPGYITPLLMD